MYIAKWSIPRILCWLEEMLWILLLLHTTSSCSYLFMFGAFGKEPRIRAIIKGFEWDVWREGQLVHTHVCCHMLYLDELVFPIAARYRVSHC